MTTSPVLPAGSDTHVAVIADCAERCDGCTRVVRVRRTELDTLDRVREIVDTLTAQVPVGVHPGLPALRFWIAATLETPEDREAR